MNWATPFVLYVFDSWKITFACESDITSHALFLRATSEETLIQRNIFLALFEASSYSVQTTNSCKLWPLLLYGCRFGINIKISRMKDVIIKKRKKYISSQPYWSFQFFTNVIDLHSVQTKSLWIFALGLKGVHKKKVGMFLFKVSWQKITLLWICLEAVKRPSLSSSVFQCRDDKSVSSVKNFIPLWLGGLCWLAKYSIKTGRNCIFFLHIHLGPLQKVSPSSFVGSPAECDTSPFL